MRCCVLAVVRIGCKRRRSVSDVAICATLCELKDAIGAIGIARCFTFGGHKKRPLYDPEVRPATELTKEQYMEQGRNATTINHFYEVRPCLHGPTDIIRMRRCLPIALVYMSRNCSSFVG